MDLVPVEAPTWSPYRLATQILDLPAIPGSRLVVYPDTGHLVPWQEPVRIASDLTAFVAQLL